MSTIVVYPKNEEQEKALMLILDAFDVIYEKEQDETEYLMSTEANREALDESIRQLEAGKGVKVSLKDLWQ
jgi:PHD/YefM family antitoxin component YafN of YafNO toxin-antitoxin module